MASVRLPNANGDNKELIRTVEQLFLDWYQHDISRRLKNPQIPLRLYNKEIAPHIGKLALTEVNARDIRHHPYRRQLRAAWRE